MKIKSLLFLLFIFSFFNYGLTKTKLFSIKVSGTVSGLAAGESVSIYNNLITGSPTDTLSNGSFTYSYNFAIGDSYSFVIGALNSGKYCNVVNGSGNQLYSNVINVEVNCSNTASLFTAVGQNGQVVMSADGLSWNANKISTTTQTLNDALILNDNSLLVVGNAGTYFLNYDNQWRQGNLSVNSDLNSITSFTDSNNQSLFVVVGNNGLIETSQNPYLWLIQSYLQPVNIMQVINCNKNFYAAANYSNNTIGAILSSNSTAVNWNPVYSSTAGTTFNSLFCYRVQSQGQTSYTIFAVGNNGALLSSSDGIQWTPSVINNGYNFTQITSNPNGDILAVGSTLDGTTGVVFRSTDAGVTWKILNSGTVVFAPLTGIAINDKGIVVVVGGKNIYVSSDNLVTWTQINAPEVLTKVKVLG